MPNKLGAAVASAVVLAMACAACTSTSGGVAVPVENTPPTGSPESTSKASRPSGVELPPRPKEIKIDAVDPCKLLTAAQMAQLEINKAEPRTSDVSVYKGAKECAYLVSDAGGYRYLARLITNEGIEPWLSGKRNVDAEQATVAGYAAARFYLKGAKQTTAVDCSVAVDVASGQHIWFSMVVNTRGGFTLDQMCQMNEHVADLAITALAK
ncbi:DUF3558 domain-containing protein [Actinokineospora auranticolor]|uniref:Uncharacterized protein DUF3558 n=1 Tax=Actinokineospora auranticolor TaxID=155976 RepID=A0A2S6GRT7_9PSEU|nr:DUF3558 domain-containing protein [Actinokineospora auranticolor]PPK67887.1 uncharacterized protein DUF3558 [Actinokineospora auranticolor]